MTKASSQADFYLPPIGDLAIPSWLTRPSTSFRSMGGPWPSSWNASSCSSDGWLYFGLHCSGGHIDALYLYVRYRGKLSQARSTLLDFFFIPSVCCFRPRSFGHPITLAYDLTFLFFFCLANILLCPISPFCTLLSVALSTDEMRGGGGYTVNLTGLTYVKSLYVSPTSFVSMHSRPRDQHIFQALFLLASL